ncbi:kappaPI-actitoxin-Avd3c [Cephus cinctus]|uniref:KappaPI-actitoxin-Avd3c n=1 Tax=Cephus cinctus TaxID=211228 RepID=A0AAJ7BQF4_CEPCN|nr:kappaPI-actitoxin-Avd3c [Cephus cinctus]
MNGKITLLLLIFCVCALSHALPARRENEVARDLCKLPMAKGHCRALMHRWMYDPAVKTCVPFEYGGCAGNDNNFMSKKDCMEVCRGV